MQDSPKNPSFEFFDVTADIGYHAWGKTLDEAFQNAAMALFEVITDTSLLKKLIKKEITLEAEDEKALLYDWLAELIFLHDAEFLVFSSFKVNISGNKEEGYLLEAEAWGEEFQPSRHESRDEVKAVTYHLMEILKENGYMLQVILDV